jgi:hypothetical protein
MTNSTKAILLLGVALTMMVVGNVVILWLMLHCAPTSRYERPGLRKPMALDASSSVHESLLTGYVQQSVNFIREEILVL